MDINFDDLIQVSPPIGMALLINFALLFVRPILSDRGRDFLPMIAMVFGGIAYPLLTEPGKVLFNVRSPVAAQVVIGMVAGGASVAFHQQFKGLLRRRFGVGCSYDDLIVTGDKQ